MSISSIHVITPVILKMVFIKVALKLFFGTMMVNVP